MTAAIRVLLADDHTAIRSGLRLILDGCDDIEVVGEARDGAVAIAQARSLRPDVTLMDVRMPGTDGIAATREIVANGWSRVLVLTSFEIDEYVVGALGAGADGYLVKTIDAGPLADAVRRVAAGEAVLSPEVTRRVITGFVATERPPTVDERSTLPSDLTDREREILAALGEGLSNADIASSLFIAESTVKTHVSRILTKLGCTTRVQAAIAARRAGLVP